MSRRTKTTEIVAETVTNVTEVVTPVTETPDTAAPSEVAVPVEQTDMDTMIGESIERIQEDKPAFISRICVLKETSFSRTANSDPSRQYDVIVNGKVIGRANTYRYTEATEQYPVVRFNNFSPVWMYLDNSDGTQIKKVFKSTKTDEGVWITGTKNAEAWLKKLGAHLLKEPNYQVQEEVLAA